MTALSLLQRSLRISQPSDLIDSLRLPDFNRGAQPTRDLLDSIAQLTDLRYPAWHRRMTIGVDAVLAFYLCVSWGVFCWRISRKTFWIARMQQGRVVLNSLNAFGIVGGGCLIVWLSYSYVLLKHSYQATVHVLIMILVWLGGWVAGAGSIYGIPTNPAQHGQFFSALRTNFFLCFIPALFCIHTIALGILFQVKYNEALSLDSSFRHMLRFQPAAAQVTPEQLDKAVEVWAKFISTWSYGAVLFLCCGIWALAAAVLFAIVLILLLSELKRQKREHMSAFEFGTSVDPVWNETTSEGVPLATLTMTSRSVVHQDNLNAAGFFPPFRPSPSVFTDSASVLFDKCLRNICASCLLSIGSLVLTACVCLFTGLITPHAIGSPDRRHFMLGHLTVQILTSVALVLGGAAVTHEVITQSLQPVLAAWVYSSSSASASPARKKAPIGFRAQSSVRTTSQSLFKSVRQLPRAASKQLERTSASFEAHRGSSRQRLFSSPDASQALVALGAEEEDKARIDQSNDSQVERRHRSTSMHLREAVLSQGQAQFGARDALHASSPEAEILPYDEVRRLRGVPSLPTKVHFIRETSITYENVPPPPRARRTERPYAPSWRYPPNHPL